MEPDWHYEVAMMAPGFGVGAPECACGAAWPCPTLRAPEDEG